MANSSVLLLRGNGANGGTVFTDEIGKVITGSGNVQTSTAQYKFNGSSLAFDGAGDYLSCGSSSDFAFGSGDFTIKLWVRFNSLATLQSIIDGRPADGNGAYPCLYSNTDGSLGYYVNSADRINTGASSVSVNTWIHVELSRVSGSTRIFINGSQAGSTYTDSTSYLSSALGVRIGTSFWTASPSHFNGYLQDIHIIKGYGEHSANFTPPTAPSPRYTQFTDAKTVLCIHADGPHGSTSLTDSSGTGKTLTCVGDAKISTSKWAFGKGSIVLDGAGDYVSLPDHVDYQFDGDFTIEGWFNMAAYPADYCMIFSKYTSNTERIALYLGNNTTADSGLRFATNASGEFAGHADSTATLSSLGISLNTWYHYAVTRKGGLVRVFLNGTALAQTYTRTAALNVAGPAIQIGSRSGAFNFNGNLDDFTITKGYAKYVASFSLPTQPMPRVALALHMDPYLSGGTTFVEETGKTVTNNGVTGNADVKKFGITSGYFNGSSYLSVPSSTDFDFGTGDFTIKFFAYMTTSGGQVISRYSGSGNRWYCNAGQFVFNAGSGDVAAGSYNPTINEWAHYEFCRSGGVVYAFRNGTLTGQNTISANISLTAPVGIGRFINAVAPYEEFFKGNIDQLEVIKGKALHTANFTPPTAPSDPNCVLGLHFDGADGSTTFAEETGKAVTAVGNAQISTAQSVFGGSSLYLDGTGDRVSFASSSDFDLGTSDFTVEAWIYETGAASGFFCRRSGGASGIVFGQTRLRANIGGSWNDSWISDAAGMLTNQWVHIAFSRNGSTWRMFRNGSIVSSITNSGAVSGDSTNPAIIGASDSNGEAPFTGYIEDFRFVRSAIYTANFTPPTAPFPPNKVLGMSFDEQTSKSTVRNDAGGSPTSSNILLDASVKAVGESSARFNGTSSSILIPASTDLQLTGDFTIKGWFNLSQVNGNNMLLGSNNGASSDYVAATPTSIGMAFANAPWPGWNASISVNTWYYLFITRSSGLVRVWLNGAELTLNTGSATQAAQLFQSGVGLYMGRYGYSTPWWLNGYMDDWKIINGVAEADFSVPTKPFRDRENSKYSVYQLSEQASLKSAQLAKTPLALYADWSSDDIANDTSGNGRHATIVGDVTHGSRLGYSGFYMGGTSSYIESPQITALNDLSAGYSVEFVIDPGVKSSYSNFVNLGRGVVGNSLSGVVNIGTADTEASVSPISTQFYNAATAQGIMSCPQVSHAYSGLKHVVVTHAAGDRRIYVNGELASRDAAALPATDATRDRITIGAWPVGATDKYLGFISNVAIYGRPLTSAEVLENAKLFSAELIANSITESMSVSSTLSSILISTNILLETVSETVSATCSADSIVSVFYIYYETVAEALGISSDAIYPQEYFKSVYESAVMTSSSTCLRVLLASIVEALTKSSSAVGNKGFVETVNETVASSTSYLLSMIATVVEDIDLRDSLIGFAELIVAITESMSVTSSAVANRAVLAAVMESTEFSDEVTQNGLLQEMIREGFSMTLVQANGSEQWSGFAVNTNTSATSIYEGFRFNSYAKVGEHYYGASDTGIYRIGEAETDEGEMINAIVTTGLINLGTSARKGIDNAFIIMRNDGDCFLRVLADGQEYSYKMMHERDGKFEGSRVKIGKGLRAVTWQFEIYNSDGADFDIDGAVIYPLVLSRHV